MADVGILAINGAPKNIDEGKKRKVDVKIKNYSTSTQTRNVSLFLNGVNTGAGQLVTLDPGKEGHVTFVVVFDTAGTAALEASLFPGDSIPDNDTLTKTVVVSDKGKDKDKSKDKD